MTTAGQIQALGANSSQTAVNLKQNNLHWFLIRQMLERKDFEELKTFKQRLQMQNIKESHTQTRDGLIDEEAVWKDHEEQ